ncbi:Phage protein (N4 Gp49/phage Sf6 gene 66) family protein [Aromatoleum tolulyticum]|uniref:Phage protein (N4 Gp49/phage Sf6 gene 66) family protein n=1 Tax=Aromatoleum tolulyticum TaxID=34027 RepID=A0A1N6X115_9RHOO|nr:Gp49 family protein [Aromatoleum tolulyticum]SIQ96039.1 Phage protein (N4 Gp49/phage Sf6 gene 66) family protein [Aromatoleum tolulyticum]
MKTYLTPADVESVIVKETVENVPATTITMVTLHLRNGAKVVGINYGAIDPTRQDWSIGRSEARKQAIEKVWELEGYLLRERLAPPVARYNDHQHP